MSRGQKQVSGKVGTAGGGVSSAAARRASAAADEPRRLPPATRCQVSWIPTRLPLVAQRSQGTGAEDWASLIEGRRVHLARAAAGTAAVPARTPPRGQRGQNGQGPVRARVCAPWPAGVLWPALWPACASC